MFGFVKLERKNPKYLMVSVNNKSIISKLIWHMHYLLEKTVHFAPETV